MSDLSSRSQAVLDMPAATPGGARHAVRRSWRSVSRQDIIGVLAAAIGGMATAVFSLQLWHFHLHIPLVWGSDGIFNLMLFKSVMHGGWIFTIHSIGAPRGTQFYDFPLGTDSLHMLVMKLIGLGTSDPVKAMNIVFLLTFPGNAVAGYVVFRWLRISVPVSVVCGILFTAVPDHLLEGAAHIFTSEYVGVPIGAWLILSVLDGSSWSGIEARRGLRAWRTWLPRRPVLIFVLCVVMGTIGIYNAAFTVIMIVIAGVAMAASQRNARALIPAAMVTVLIGATVLVAIAPSIVYEHQHGANPAVAQRIPEEAEIYSLNLTALLFPVTGDRIGPLNSLATRHATAPYPDAGGSIGLVGAIGFAWLICVGFAAIIGFGRAGPWLQRHRQLAFAALVAFMCGTFGGVSTLIAYLVTPEIRVWGRIGLFIAFFALAAVGLGLDALRHWRPVVRRSWLWGLALAGILVFGVFEQSTTAGIPRYAANTASYDNDQNFVDTIQTLVPHGAAIYELPYVPFPENPPVVHMTDYDEGRGDVLTTTGLRWSYGAMKGRPADWASQATSTPVPTLVDELVAGGFSGIWLDRYGYTDNGAEMVGELQAAIGAAPISSENGRFVFFNLRPVAARLRAQESAGVRAGLRAALLNPLDVTWDNGFYGPENDGSRWALSRAPATVVNRDRIPRNSVIYADVQTLAHKRSRLTVTAPGGVTRTFTISQKPRVIKLTFNAPPGQSTVVFSSTAPTKFAPGDPRPLAVHYGTPVIAPAAVGAVLP